MDDSQGNTTVEGTTTAIPTDTKPAEQDSLNLPDGVKEETREAFEKLKQHNADLKQKLTEYESKNSVLDDLRPSQAVSVETQHLSDTQVEEVKNRFVDENGYVDVAALESALKKADENARKAEAKAQQVESRMRLIEEDAQVRVAHSEFPQLDPHNTTGFDPKFYELVRNELLSQMMKGKQDIVEAAKKVSTFYEPKVNVDQAKQQAVEEYKTKVTKRDQATEPAGQRGVSQPSDRQELIRKTLDGDRDALYKRLQASGY